MPLTWRNVDAPDFRSSLEGVRTFADLLSGAFASARGGLTQYDQTLDKRANNAALMQFAGIQDPEAAKTALSLLATRPDAYRLNAGTIESLTGRPSALIDQAAKGEGLNWTKYTHRRVEGFDKAEDAAAPLVADYYAAAGRGEGSAWLKAHPGFGTGLSLGARTNLVTGAQGYRGLELGQEGQIIGNETNRFNLTNSKEDRAEAAAGAAWMSKFLNSGLDGTDLDGQLATSGLSGRVQMMIRGQLNGMGMGGSPGGGTGGGGGIVPPLDPSGANVGPGGIDPTKVMNYEARASGYNAIPDSVKTLGDARKFALTVNSANKARMGKVGSSAMGLYQITGDTLEEFGPKTFGNGWQNQALTPQNQDKIAQKIFEEARANPKTAVTKLMGRWSSLNANTAAAIANMPWEQARAYITRGESGARNPAALLIGETLANSGTDKQYMDQNANSMAATIRPALRDNTALPGVVSSVTGDKGYLKGAPTEWVADRLQKIIAEARENGVTLNPSAASKILEKSLIANGGWFKSWNPNTVSDQWKVNPEAVTSYINEVKNADYQKVEVANATSDQRKQLANNAKTIYEQALAAYQAAQRRAANNPAFDKAKLGRLQIALEVASQNYEALLDNQGNATRANGGNGPVAPVPAVPVGVPNNGPKVSPMLQYYLRTRRPGNGSMLLR